MELAAQIASTSTMLVRGWNAPALGRGTAAGPDLSMLGREHAA